jgi:hypothetical protein
MVEDRLQCDQTDAERVVFWEERQLASMKMIFQQESDRFDGEVSVVIDANSSSCLRRRIVADLFG